MAISSPWPTSGRATRWPRCCCAFASNPGKVFTCQQVFEHIWGEDGAIDSNSITVFIRRIREKIEDNGADYPITLFTYPGVFGVYPMRGYWLRVPCWSTISSECQWDAPKIIKRRGIMSKNLERRDFLKGAAALGATAAVAGLVGCSSPEPKDDSASTGEGSGAAGGDVGQVSPRCGEGLRRGGLRYRHLGPGAIVQAAELGASVIALEAAPQPGGNGLGVEGSFANGSPLQKEQGINFEFGTLIAQEMAATQYRVDARLWRDLYDNSGANIEWLISNGVEFSGDVNDYGTGAGIVSMHWYKEGSAGVGYVPPPWWPRPRSWASSSCTPPRPSTP